MNEAAEFLGWFFFNRRNFYCISCYNSFFTGVPKRRLYDITNVLEGVDLIEKVGKNSIRWRLFLIFNFFLKKTFIGAEQSLPAH